MSESAKSSRASGLLLHITSLPSAYGIGDLGPEAYRFADFMAASKQKLWQVLPLVPTGYGYSPYAAPSTYAGNAMLISPDRLLEDGWLTTDDVGVLPSFPVDSVAFADVSAYKEDLLIRAWKRFSSHASPAERKAFDTYCETHADWLEDWALFETIKQDHDEKEWMTWRADLRDREPSALIAYQAENADQIAMRKFWQFLFEQQWMDLKSYCNERGIRIFGDLPIYVAQDSADVWANRHLFTLKEDGYPTTIAGVPPDYFSETGQRWGNPLYKWDSMRATGYAWWTSRMARILELVDLVRLDHFRGFEAYWEVPASEETAIHGQWREGPGADLFDKLEKNLGDVPLIAENLGVITEGVTKLMDRFGFPGMAILQFAFDSDESNEFLPHNYREALVAYTGTHDNDTLKGWWSDTASTQNAEQIARAKAYCTEYLGLESGHEAEQLSWKAIESLMHSVARYVVTPVQDLLGLGAYARMNTPGTTNGNWGWRLAPGALDAGVGARLATLTEASDR
ncbi:MAG: 4-alpha-glucanotransferase [Rhodothermales bacterium]